MRLDSVGSELTKQLLLWRCLHKDAQSYAANGPAATTVEGLIEPMRVGQAACPQPGRGRINLSSWEFQALTTYHQTSPAFSIIAELVATISLVLGGWLLTAMATLV